MLDLFFNLLTNVVSEAGKSIFSGPTTSPGPIVSSPSINSVVPTPNSVTLKYESLIPFEDIEVTPQRGSIVVTDLVIALEHTGIYSGNDKIIHRSGDGYIEEVSTNKFMERLNGLNPSFTSYVACVDDRPLSSMDIYRRAKKSLDDTNHKQHYGYNLISKNCHNFTRYCLTGDGDQWGLDFTFNSLQVILKYTFNVNSWRILR